MILGDNWYVPALGWRQAEYQALNRLAMGVRRRVVPMITIPQIEYDFEHRRLKRTVQKFVEPFVGRYLQKWGFRPAWIALHERIALDRMDGGVHVFDYLFDRLRQSRTRALPAVRLKVDSDTVAAAARAVTGGANGVGVIVGLEDLANPSVRDKVEALGAGLGVSLDRMDLVVDLGAPASYEPYGELASALLYWMKGLGSLESFRNVVLVGTAIPRSFKGISRGNDEIPRHDWLFYKALLRTLPEGMRRPTYGDYGIVHPEFDARDPRTMKPAAKLIYAKKEAWATRKGGSFRDNRMQMQGHCACVMRDPHFEYRGSAYSDGDRRIMTCATGIEGTGSLGRWKDAGLTHHITMAVECLANLGAGTSNA